MLRDGLAIGTITLHTWATPRPFTDAQIELLKTFADQAVIAIENVRLFKETREALEQQTAMSEILRAISTSPTELQPVLDAVVKSAVRFCGAHDAELYRLDGNRPEGGRPPRADFRPHGPFDSCRAGDRRGACRAGTAGRSRG